MNLARQSPVTITALSSPVGVINRHPRCDRSVRRRSAGVSLVELMLALAITAMLLTATMVALDASFKAYASAAEEASTQTQTRMIVQRLLTLIRTSTAHAPVAISHANNQQVSSWLGLIDPNGQELTIGYKASADETKPELGYLWIVQGPINQDIPDEPPVLLTGVTLASFTTHSRRGSNGDWVLERATVDIKVVPSPDSTLALESGRGQPIRIIASTMPRKLD